MKTEKEIKKEVMNGDAFQKIWDEAKPKHQGGYWQCWCLALKWVLEEKSSKPKIQEDLE